MPGTSNAQNPFAEGDLNQELIDQMLNGGEPKQNQWGDDSLQAEIEAARAAAGVMPGPEIAPTPLSAASASAHGPGRTPTAVHPVQFMPLAPDPQTMENGHGIELLMDVALEVSVELGRSHMSIGEILSLRTGSVIELDKLAGEPVDVSVNGTLIARGEVVVVDEKFGVRITEVVSKARRLASVG